jgi:hypothetical protein
MKEQSYNDPLNEEINTLNFSEAQKDFVNQVNSIRSLHYGLLLTLIVLALLPFIGIFYFYFFKTFNAYIFIFSFIPVFGFYTYIKGLQNEIFIYLVCEKMNWAFNPNLETKRASKLALSFPIVFKRGTDYQLQDQIWGTYDNKTKIDFWAGTFSYTQNREDYSQSAFIINTSKPLSTTFALYRWGEKSIYRTESEKFNELFKIRSNSNNSDTRLRIMKLLSPSVQVRLIDMANKYSLDCIAFEENCMIILFSNKFWKVKYTNFFKNITIDQRDMQVYEDLMTEMVALPLEMIRYLK